MRRSVGQVLGVLLTVLIPVTTGIGLYDFASKHQHKAFWDYTPGALMLYGRAADGKFRKAYRQANESALAHGFRFADPELIQTNELFNLWYRRWQSSYVIAVSTDGSKIIIDGPWMMQFADDDLECIFAHELGHVIEFQHQSDDHELMRRLQCLDSQERADAIGRILCGYERYQTIVRRYIKNRPLVVRQCDGSTPLP